MQDAESGKEFGYDANLLMVPPPDNDNPLGKIIVHKGRSVWVKFPKEKVNNTEPNRASRRAKARADRQHMRRHHHKH